MSGETERFLGIGADEDRPAETTPQGGGCGGRLQKAGRVLLWLYVAAWTSRSAGYRPALLTRSAAAC